MTQVVEHNISHQQLIVAPTGVEALRQRRHMRREIRLAAQLRRRDITNVRLLSSVYSGNSPEDMVTTTTASLCIAGESIHASVKSTEAWGGPEGKNRRTKLAVHLTHVATTLVWEYHWHRGYAPVDDFEASFNAFLACIAIANSR